MTFDTTPLERDCVILNCSRPAVDPARNKVHCAKHDPDPPKPAPVIGQDPDTQEPMAATIGPALTRPEPDTPDMATMEPVWDGTQFVLRVKQPARGPDVGRIEGLVRELMFELGIPEADR